MNVGDLCLVGRFLAGHLTLGSPKFALYTAIDFGSVEDLLNTILESVVRLT